MEWCNILPENPPLVPGIARLVSPLGMMDQQRPGGYAPPGDVFGGPGFPLGRFWVSLNNFFLRSPAG